MPISSPNSPKAEHFDVRWLGRVAFEPTALLQEQIRQGVQRGETRETLLLCEHDPVITMGRSARAENVLLSREQLAERNVTLLDASRGGDVTYHGPGQLVGYPIFKLRKGVVDHLERMAAALLVVLTELGVTARWRRDIPGLWVGGAKICAFGVHVQKRVSIHGFALNLSVPLEAFSTIVPCGLCDSGVTSVQQLTGKVVDVGSLVPAVARSFDAIFALDQTAPPIAENGMLSYG